MVSCTIKERLLFRGNIDAFNAHMPNRRILEENLTVPTLKLSRAELDRIESRTLAESRGSCRHCGCCNRACPEGVNVAAMLRCHAYVHNYGDRASAKTLYANLSRDRAHLCSGCGACQVACPESLDLAAVIASLRATLS